MAIPSSGCGALLITVEAFCGPVLDSEAADGRADQARMSELATRTRWKIVDGRFAVEDEGLEGEGSSVHRRWISLKEEQENAEEEDDAL